MESDREIWIKAIMRMKNGNELDGREIQIEGNKAGQREEEFRKR